MEGYLHLSNGMKFKGELIGAPVSALGEAVFTTAMVGYTQTLTDPSFFGQILTFTYPLMGNYGVPEFSHPRDEIFCSEFESKNVHTAGVIVSHHSQKAFHWRCSQTLDDWLKRQGIPGLSEIDTRQLTQVIRSSKGLLAAISPEPEFQGKYYTPNQELILPKVSIKERKIIGKGPKRVALIDCGVKWNIIRQILSENCEVELLPWDTSLNTVDCDAWLISNGPGDPELTGDLIPRVRELLHQDRPILGICLGFQILALASGAKTRKLEFGHRGLNQPVQLVGTQKGYITSQNHGYTVIEDTLPKDWTPWFRHLNDQTLEGIKHQNKPFYGVQFHPEASAGPQDTAWILKEYVRNLGKDAR